MRRCLLVCLLLITSACAGKARHIAVVADATFAQSVFAVDDAQFAICHSTGVSPIQPACDQSDPFIKDALKDVRAVTATLQQLPKDAPLPKTLPALIADLRHVEQAVAPLKGMPGPPGVVAQRAATAMEKALALLNAFTGAQ